jgi:hypothetical protein
MAKQTSKMATPARKTTTTKPPSPKKSKKTPNMREKLLQKKEATIHVVGFENPIALEVYDYTLTVNKARFINNYTESGLKVRSNSRILQKRILSG